MAAHTAQLQILSQAFTVFTGSVNEGFKEINRNLKESDKESCARDKELENYIRTLAEAFNRKVQQDEKDKLSARLWVATIVSIASLISGVILKFFHLFWYTSCMNVVTPILGFVKENPELVALLGTIVVISYPKLPLPDKFEGKWFYFPYLVIHQLLARVSVMKWNQTGGSLKVPGLMVPTLEQARREETLQNLAKGIQSAASAPVVEPELVPVVDVTPVATHVASFSGSRQDFPATQPFTQKPTVPYALSVPPASMQEEARKAFESADTTYIQAEEAKELRALARNWGKNK